MGTFRWWYGRRSVAQQRALPRGPGHLVWTSLLGLSFLLMVAPQALAQEQTDVPTGSIEGRAVLAQDSTTVMPGTQVLLISADTAHTGAAANADGYFTIDDAPAGTQTLRTEYFGFASAVQDVDVAAGETTVVTVYVGMFVSEDDLMFSPSDAERDLAEGQIIILEDSDILTITQLSTECADALDRIRSEVEQEWFGIEHRTVTKDDDQPLEVWIRSIRAYNDVVKAYLEETHGEDWAERVRERTWERVREEGGVCP